MRGEEEEKKKDVYTIRGLDPELYELFSRRARELGINVGRLMNEAMRILLALTEISVETGKILFKKAGEAGEKLAKLTLEVADTDKVKKALESADIIRNIEELRVSRKDLEALDKPIIFANLKKLVFEDDVDEKLIMEKVASIKLVDEVIVPAHVPKLAVARKCSMVKRILSKEE